MNVGEEMFYDSSVFSIMPMSFCYPGKGTSGDLAPCKECAPLWHPKIFESIKTKPLIILIGQYAQRYYLKNKFNGSLTETVNNYAAFLPEYFPLPHPSPRNQNWVKINPWFMEGVVPELQKRIRLAISVAKLPSKAN